MGLCALQPRAQILSIYDLGDNGDPSDLREVVFAQLGVEHAPQAVHQLLAQAGDDCYAEIRSIQKEVRGGLKRQFIWPMIILRTPRGWTRPKEVDGIPIEGTFRRHEGPHGHRLP